MAVAYRTTKRGTQHSAAHGIHGTRRRSTEGVTIVDIAAAAMGHLERPGAGVVQRIEITAGMTS